MKLLVTTKNVLLLGINGDVYEPDRPTLVSNDMFCQSKVAAGVVQVLKADLPEAATDAEWLKFYRESNKDFDLAYDAFLSKYEAEAELKAEVEKLEAEEPVVPAPAEPAEPVVPAPVEPVEPAPAEPAVEPAKVESKKAGK